MVMGLLAVLNGMPPAIILVVLLLIVGGVSFLAFTIKAWKTQHVVVYREKVSMAEDRFTYFLNLMGYIVAMLGCFGLAAEIIGNFLGQN